MLMGKDPTRRKKKSLVKITALGTDNIMENALHNTCSIALMSFNSLFFVLENKNKIKKPCPQLHQVSLLSDVE